MSEKHKVAINYLLLLLDVITAVLSFALATFIRFGNFRNMEDKSTHFGACAIFVMIAVLYTLIVDQHREFLRRGIMLEAYQVLRYNVLLMITGLVILYALHTTGTISRLVIGYFFVINLVLTWLVHLLAKRMIRSYWRSAENSTRVLVISERETLEECIRRLLDTLDISYRVVAAVCIDEDLTGREIAGIPVIADRKGLIAAAPTLTLDEVFIWTPGIPQRELADVIEAFHDMGVAVHFSLEIRRQYGGSSQMGMFGGYSVISYSHTTGRHRGLVLKRFTDILGGIVGLIITGILTPFLAAAIRLDSPGPVFFSQTRVGRNGRRFRIYKFRTMVANAEKMKRELAEKNEMQGPIFKMQNDPRITRVGAFLRKTSLDEFPQFWNVLRGDMSLVGTRPPTEEEFAQYDPHYRRRLSMTPGLTGLWQVSGRSSVQNFDDVVRFDLEYIDNWSLKLDLWILCKTIGVVFFGRGAA
ncbi:MAG: sugar transferase [Lachnospiraceae bacterium]|nr:sugar transferase [Lachnospiraceae bacterium]